MNVTWVRGYPTGHEEGNFLVVDMGGTNIRVCEVDLSGGKGIFEITQNKYEMPPGLKNGTADQLWDYISGVVSSFVHERYNAGQTSKKIPLAFTFSYPVDQAYIDQGVLQRWTKGFDISGVEGHDVVKQFEAALESKVCICKRLSNILETFAHSSRKYQSRSSHWSTTPPVLSLHQRTRIPK